MDEYRIIEVPDMRESYPTLADATADLDRIQRLFPGRRFAIRRITSTPGGSVETTHIDVQAVSPSA